MYYLLGLAVVFAFFAAVNLMASIAVWLLWRLAGSRIEARLSHPAAASAIFWLRVGPAGLAVLVAAGMVAPAYLLYEPLESGEAVGVTLSLVTVLGIAGLAMAIFRAAANALATRRLSRQWLAQARTEVLEGLPVLVMSHPFPVMAVVGVFRPRIFVSDIVNKALDEGELKAAVAHERAHLQSRDNLKRALNHFCRDLLVVPVGVELDRAWARNCERAADRAAVLGQCFGHADLASALIKIARLAPRGAAPVLPAGAYIATGESDIADRVAWLMGRKNAKYSRRHLTRSLNPIFFSTAALVAASAAALGPFDILRRIHDVTELVVHTLR